MKKIIHVIAGNLFGGVESFLVTLCNSSPAERGVEHVFALCFPGRLQEEVRLSGTRNFLIGPAKILGWSQTRKARKNLGDLLRSEKPDVAVCHMSWSQILFSSTVASFAPWVAHHHGPTDPTLLDWLATRKKPDLIIAPSNHSSMTWRNKYRMPVSTLNYPVRQEFAAGCAANLSKGEARKKFGLPQDKVVILQCSRVEPWKGHDILLDALARMKGLDGWHMAIAGSPQKDLDRAFMTGLREKCAKADLESRVTWLGDVRDVVSLMSAADLYCQANRGPEGFSLAFLEAAFSGLPIVTTGIGGAPEIIEGNGILVPTPDPALFAEALTSLVRDPDLRKTQSAAAVEIGRRKGNPQNQVREYERLCLSVSKSG